MGKMTVLMAIILTVLCSVAFGENEIPEQGENENTWGTDLNNYLEKGQGRVDVRAFLDVGFVRDGSVDYTTEFQEAADAAVSLGSALFIPEGTWKAALSIADGDDDLIIEGAGRELTILTAPDDSTAVIAIAVGAEDIIIRAMTIVTGEGNNNSHYGISSSNSPRLILMDLKINGFNIDIRLVSSGGVRLVRCLAQTADATGGGVNGTGIYIQHATAGIGTHVIDSQSFANEGTGILLVNQTLPHIRGVLSNANGVYGMHLDGVDGSVNDGFSIVDCEFDSNADGGLLIEHMEWGNATNIWASSVDGFGVKLDKVLYSGFNDIQAVNSTANTVHGIHLTGNSLYNGFSSCVSHLVSGDGFLIDDGSFGNTFSSCNAVDNDGIGFNFDDVTAAQPNQIFSCYSLLNTGGQFAVQIKDKVNSMGEIHGSFKHVIRTLANDATPSVIGADVWLTGGTTTITDFDDGPAGQILTVLCKHSLTFDFTTGQDANHNLNGSSADITADTGDILVFLNEDGTKWQLRSNNDASVDNN